MGMEIKDDELNLAIAWAIPASELGIQRVLAADVSLDGRSQFMWLRLRNGDLALATFPRGATYEDLEQETAIPASVISVESFPYEKRGGVHYVRIDGVSVAFFRMENGQLYVGVNTEDAERDNAPDGEPYVQIVLNDATLYDRERPETQHPSGPLLLRCTFVPQRDTDPGRGLTTVEPIDPAILGRPWHELTWTAEYDEAPSEQRNYGSDALRDHPDVPQWIKDWDGPFEIDFQVRYTVVGMYDGMGGEAARYAEAFWADDPKHAMAQAHDSARASGETLTVSAVLYGDAQVAA